MAINWLQYRTFLSVYLRPHRRKVALLSVLLLAGISLQLLTPQILRSFIDTARGGGALQALVLGAWAYLIAGFVSQLCTACTGYVGADIGWLATNALRADLTLHCLRLDMPFHHLRTPGEMIERIDGDVNALANFFAQFLVTVAGNVLLLIGVLALLFREDWRVGTVLTLFAVVATCILVKMRDYAVPAQKAEREQSAAMMGYVEERLGGLDDVRANGLGAHALRGFSDLARTLFHAVMKAAMTRNAIWFTMLGLFLLGNLSALIMGALLYRQGTATLGTVYLFFQYNTMLLMPLEQLTRQMQDLQQAGAGLVRVQELLAETPQIVDGTGGALPEGPLAVDFEAVTFGYGDGEPVLHQVSFGLAAGRVLGVLGRTGSGKTTMMRLLYRLYDLTEGRIRVGGMDLRDVTLADLRRHIGMVTQDVQLFHATVRDNLTFFDRTISDARILAVVHELGLQDWLASLPAGLDTELQAGGMGLSAGESQLLAFTRVFLANPGLVLLDEPSSRLDPATERLIDRAVERLLCGRTCIIIAHRLGTVQRADEILILDDGHLIEHGPRAHLAQATESRFAHLLRTGLEKELA